MNDVLVMAAFQSNTPTWSNVKVIALKTKLRLALKVWGCEGNLLHLQISSKMKHWWCTSMNCESLISWIRISNEYFSTLQLKQVTNETKAILISSPQETELVELVYKQIMKKQHHVYHLLLLNILLSMPNGPNCIIHRVRLTINRIHKWGTTQVQSPRLIVRAPLWMAAQEFLSLFYREQRSPPQMIVPP